MTPEIARRTIDVRHDPLNESGTLPVKIARCVVTDQFTMIDRIKIEEVDVSYATVHEYNSLRDELPELTPIGTDLKDFQRPWVVSKLLQNYSSGTVLEIGANRCELADYLQRKGFQVWVVDVYDSFGGGRATFEEVTRRFPRLNIHTGFFHEDRLLPTDFFDCIYSCSVLEHTPLKCIGPTIGKIFDCLKVGGLSIHAVDFTVETSIMPAHPLMNEILRCCGSDLGADEIREKALADRDTFYLSPQGHYGWRRLLDKSYDEYPYRRVTSINVFARKCASSTYSTKHLEHPQTQANSRHHGEES